MRSRNARSTLLIINKQDIVCHHHRMSFLRRRTGAGGRAALITASNPFPFAWSASSPLQASRPLPCVLLPFFRRLLRVGGGQAKNLNKTKQKKIWRINTFPPFARLATSFKKEVCASKFECMQLAGERKFYSWGGVGVISRTITRARDGHRALRGLRSRSAGPPH